MTSSTPLLLLQDDLRNTFGTIFIGVIFAAVLFGVVTIQAFIYFQTHRSTEMTFFKIAVLFLWTLDAFHMTLIAHFSYYYLVVSYANFEAYAEIVWSAKLHIIPAILIVWSIHFLYAYRIWIVSRGRPRALPIMVLILVTLNLGVGIVAVWEIYQCNQFADLPRMKWLMLWCLSMIGFTDFVIASSLVYLFATSRTGFSNTDSFLKKLMVYIINTGCLTSMLSMATILACAVMPSNFLYMTLQFVGAKLYTNSFLALMNAGYYQEPYTDIAELRVLGGVHRPDLSTCKELEDENPRTSQANMSACSHGGRLHYTRPVQAATLPMAMRIEVKSVSDSPE